jgi:pimeloyl-ACP methyl ester carboxylesterase
MLFRRILPVVALLALVATFARAADDQSFDSNGVKIHYTVQGEGDPVVLIHGFTANTLVQWAVPGIISNLSKEYQVIALDNRGHGKSEKPHDPKQYGPEMALDAIRLLDHLKIKKAHIVGYSMGGFITNYLVATHPDRIISATLGGAGWSRPGDSSRTQVMNELASSLDEGKGIGPLILALNPADRPKPTEDQIANVNQLIMAANDQKALAACIRGMAGLTDPEAKLKANKVPTLAIIGELDPLKLGVDELQTVMSDLKVEVIKGADHMTAFRSPKFIEDLTVFLAAHAKVKAAAAAGAR